MHHITDAPQHQDLPVRVGPAEFTALGAWVTVRCPHEYDALMRLAGGVWDPGGGRWFIDQRRIGPVIHELRRRTDPLFRQAGIDLDGREPR
jgi:hypothetical protein